VRSTPRSLASPLVINIHDLRRLAHGRLPKVVFDYPDGGAESEVTLRENCRVFDDVTFRPRQAVAIPECDLHTRVLSADLAFPAILAPIGYSRLMHPGGEVAAAASAEEAGLAYTLSTISGHWRMSEPPRMHPSGINSTSWGDARLLKGPLTALVAPDSRRWSLLSTLRWRECANVIRATE